MAQEQATSESTSTAASQAAPTVAGLESGIYLSDADEGQVWVRLDSIGEAVRAVRAGYPSGFVFEPGDETSVEFTDGAWHTIPTVAYTVQLASRTEWWTKNRYTGQLRFLTEMGHSASSPSPFANEAGQR